MKISKASPKLFLAALSGQHLKKATMTGRRSGQDFLQIILSDVLISSYKETGETENLADEVTLKFSKIEIEYRPQKADGRLDTPIKAGWDIKQNKKL